MDYPELPVPEIEGTLYHPVHKFRYIGPAHFTAAQMHAYLDADRAQRAAPVSEAAHAPFKAMAQGEVDYSVDVFPIDSPEFGSMMTIGAQEGAIYITKEQAIHFWNLIDATPQPVEVQPVFGDAVCCNPNCTWGGKLSDCSMLGAVGPLCPDCREVVEPCGAQPATHADAAAAVPAPGASAEPLIFNDFPEFHHEGMGCGLEDRGITDRYEAMRYGWDQAMESVALNITGFLSDLPQAAPMAQLNESPETLREREMAMMLRRIISSARRNCEDESNVLKLANEAWKYFAKEGLQGSPFRDSAAAPTTPKD